MRKFTADYIFPVASHPIRKGVVIVDDQGKVLALGQREDYDPASLETYTGIIVPGFINTHCHLELSHMKGMAPTGTGLLPFLKTVVNFRDISMEEIQDAIEKADREMYEGGIVAVGDISNKLDTAAQKEKSPIHYYTFVEMFDFMQETMTEQVFGQYKAVYDGQSSTHGNRKSCVPHAPYTVSPGLFQRINAMNEAGATVSIHNQETAHEDEFFRTGKGGFMDFFRSFGFSMDHFRPTGQASIYYALQQMGPSHRTLFVHNTMTTPADIQAAQTWSDKVYWATCANANLYIENRLPHYNYFIDNNARMTIGTDSLTSNWQLSVLEEMKTIARYQSYIHFDTLLRWATLNGAEALGFEEELGSIEVGKRPGLNLLNLDEGLKLTAETRVRRLV
ncbi:MAG: amidohydrolase family protein [Lewinellaceae bacterium]|nr:amidohydrolase family protein [Lewinellaceae bacterium]